MSSPVVGEFMGTMVLVLSGDGVVASVLLKKCKAEGAGWIVITTGWALAVLMGVFTAIAFGSPGAHINPAVTLCFAIVSGNFANVIPSCAQLAGAFCGATLVWLHFLPHWKETPDQGVEAGSVLHGAGNPKYSLQPVLRNSGNARIARYDRLYFFKERGWGGLFARPWTLLCGMPGMGDWLVPGRDHGLCHQSRP